MRVATAVVALTVLLGVVTDAQRGRKLTGTVEDARSGRRISGAQVLYEESGLEPQSISTDSKGGFEISNATSGVVTVSARGYATMKRGWPPRQGSTLTFEMTAPSIVSGSLVDAVSRQGLAGRVILTVKGRYHHVSKGALAQGLFRFVGLPTGPAIAVAYADGYAPHYSELTVEAGKESATSIGLLREASAAGTVQDAGGDPITGATVYVAYGDSVPGAGKLAGFAAGFNITDSEGTFGIHALVPNMDIYMQAELNGRVSDIVTVPAIAAGTERSGIVLALR